MDKERTFEDSIVKLDEIVQELAEEEVTLEQSLEMYKEGMLLVNYCNTAIDKIEKELEIIKEDKG